MDAAAATPLVIPDDDIEAPAREPGHIPTVKENEAAGRGLGIVLMALLIAEPVVSLALSSSASAVFIVQVSLNVAATIVASVIAFGMCCAADYDLKPNVRRFAIITLILLCIMLVLFTVMVVAYRYATEEDYQGRNNRAPDANRVIVVTSSVFLYVAVFILYQVLNIAAIAFASLFTFGRGCCAPRV